MRFRINESVKKIDGCYYTYSYMDLRNILTNEQTKGELIRIVGIPGEELFGINNNQTKIHNDILITAQNEGMTDCQFGDIVHFYSIYDDDIETKLECAKQDMQSEEKEWFSDYYKYISFLKQAFDGYQISKSGDLLIGWFILKGWDKQVENQQQEMIQKVLQL